MTPLPTQAGHLVVRTSDLVNGAVTTPKLARDAVRTAKLPDGAVRTAKIADGAVTTSNIAAGAVTRAELEDGAVIGQKLSDLAVSRSKIFPFSVGPSQLGLIVTRSATVRILPTGFVRTATATCPEGGLAISGGADWVFGDDEKPFVNDFDLIASFRSSSNAWTATGRNSNSSFSGPTRTLRAFVHCLT